MDAATRLAHAILPQPERRRPELNRRIVIIGAGPGGIIAAVRLQQAGYDDITILEAGDAVGGTWRTNTYPGCACDVQSPLYSFSFAPKTDWSVPYAPQQEILGYVREVAAHYGVDQLVQTGARVAKLAWDDAANVWRIGLDCGTSLTADVVISAIGLFGEPQKPSLPGIETFKGWHWHSARWPAYANLSGKRVAVIGSGATAVQIVPELAKVTKELLAFIRSPQWLLPRAPVELPEFDRSDDLEAAAALIAIRGALFQQLDRVITFAPDILTMGAEGARKHLEQIEDEATRAALKPDSPWGCYRFLVSDDFYPAFNQPHVRAVRNAIARVASEGIITADGTQHPLDVIIFATGYKTTSFLSSIEVKGREGRALADDWSGGPYAHLGVDMPGFPNLFQLYGPNTNAGSIFFMMECQTDYIVRRLQQADKAGARIIEIDSGTAHAFDRGLKQSIDRVGVWKTGCANYYSADSGRNVTQWPETMTAYLEQTIKTCI
jgi:cation diffusion facilitator CzcD-associated flavoprotein CzcO